MPRLVLARLNEGRERSPIDIRPLLHGRSAKTDVHFAGNFHVLRKTALDEFLTVLNESTSTMMKTSATGNSDRTPHAPHSQRMAVIAVPPAGETPKRKE